MNTSEPILSTVLLIALLLIFLVIIIFTAFSRISKFTDSLRDELSKTRDQYDELSKSINNMSDIIDNSRDEKFNLLQFPKNLDDRISEFIKVIVNSSKRTYDIVNNEQRASLNDIRTIMSTFEDSIKSKSEELNIYKEGYDYIKNKNILDEMFELISSLRSYNTSLEETKDVKSKEMIQAAIDKLSIILSNNNIEEYNIKPGTNIKDNLECEVIDTEEHSESSQINTVIRTIDSGYKILLDDSSTKIIKKATVSVYR